ncbi:MAG: methylated-DNA--[protein]-cysteine S-methyltransferase [Actinobacteria bacterium]|nr:methylated-DNA--[protein]-cysteine S-methyltransferase [Actinomycetota bacterium]
MPAATAELDPDLDLARVAAAIRFLDAHRGEQPGLAEVARHLHLSESHAHRLFTAHAGTSPKRFLRWLTATAARDLLRERRAVLDVTTGTGLSSPGRLHDLMVTVDALTPGEVARGGAGLTVRAATHPSPLGPVAVGITGRGVCLLRFVDGSDHDAAVEAVRREWPAADVVVDVPGTAAPVAAAFGPEGSGPVSLAVAGTNLQLKVWEALLTVPAGQVTTYGDLARALERPTAARAVASAVAANPVAVLIPCHRVIRGTGALAGYRWGTDRKRVLLAREAAAAGSGG